MTACIVGWAHGKFGKRQGEDLEALIVEVATDAIADAGLAPSGHRRDLCRPFRRRLREAGFPGLAGAAGRPTRCASSPSTRVENACATGSAAVHMGLKSIAAARRADRAGRRRREDDRDAGRPGRRHPDEGLLRQGGGPRGHELRRRVRPDRAALFPALRRPVRRDGPDRGQEPQERLRSTPRRRCARISATSSAAPSPTRTRWSPGRCAAPIARLVSDGAAALVLADVETALALRQGGACSAPHEHVNDFLPMSRRDIIAVRGLRAGLEAGASRRRAPALDDLRAVETHDCFTIAELLQYEAMGLTPHGQGARAALEGWTEKDGRLPVNASGGLKSKGHPIGATGVSMHILAAMQADRHGRRDAGEERPASPASSTWAARRSPTTSSSSSRCEPRAAGRV